MYGEKIFKTNKQVRILVYVRILVQVRILVYGRILKN